MHIAFGQNAKDNVPRQREWTFEQFVRFIQTRPPFHGTLTFAEYSAATKKVRGPDKDSTWFIPAKFIRPERRADAVESNSGFVCDFDDGAIGRAEIESRLADLSYVGWTSYSHGVGGHPRWRVFIPYDRPATRAEHELAYDHFQGLFEGHLDPRCKTVSQLWYLPGHPRDATGAEIIAVCDGHPYILRTVAGNQRAAPSGNAGLTGTLHPALAAGAASVSALESRPPTSLQDVAAALSCLDPAEYEDYTRWLDISFAVYDGTKGSPDGLKLFVAWSKTCPGWVEGAPEEKWASHGRTHRANGITVATLFSEAQKSGRAPGFNNFLIQPSGNSAAAAPEVQPPQPIQDSRNSQPHSPVAALPVPVTAPVPMPANYRNDPRNLAIQKIFDDGDSPPEWKTVLKGFNITSFDLAQTVDEESHSAELIVVNRNGSVSAAFGTGIMSNNTEFWALLNDRGIFCNPNELKELKDLLMEWLKKIQEEQRVKRSFTHLGWMEKGGIHLGFAHGDTAYYPTGQHESGIKIATPKGKEHAKYFIPQGSRAKWQSVADFLAKQGNPSLLAIFATSFGSPLMRFSGHSGAVVSIVSSASGVGKSSTLLASQSVWGRPGTTVHAATDTILSLASKMGFTKNLPVYWDDIKGNAKLWQTFSDTIYQITQGKEKSRLFNTGNPQPSQEWCCLAIVAANDSIFEVMKRYNGDTDSGVTRVFEIRDEERPDPVPNTFFAQCRDNFGWAGAEYAEWLSQNYAVAEQRVQQVTASLTLEVKMTSEERFWVAAMATMIVGAMFAKHLKLVDFDVPALKKFLVKRFYELRIQKAKAAVDVGPKEQVSDLIYDHQATTLQINKISVNGKVPPVVVRPPANKVVDITLVKDDGSLRVRRSKFNEWCQKKGLSPETLRLRLEKAKAIKEVNGCPAGGEPTYGSKERRVRCYDIDLAKLDLSGDVSGNST